MPKGKYPRLSPEVRFWNKVNKEGDCWVWTGCILRNYGGLQLNGRIVKVHRFSWELHFGTIPKGMSVCHTCDNPICVKPEHLFLGDAKSNAEDRERKGRGNHHLQQGELHHQAKLTTEQVISMRRVRKETGISYARLGKMFKISTMQAWDIVNGNGWRHVTE